MRDMKRPVNCADVMIQSKGMPPTNNTVRYGGPFVPGSSDERHHRGVVNTIRFTINARSSVKAVLQV